MSTHPTPLLPPLPIITPFSEESLGRTLSNVYILAPASGTAIADVARFWPFSLQVPATAQKMFMMNGAAAAGSFDLGIYDSQFKRVVSHGGALQSGTNAIQELDITDTLLPAGDYWMAMSMNNVSTSFFRLASTITDEIYVPAIPSYDSTPGGYPLPATPTVIKTTATVVYVPVLGVVFASLI